MEKKQNWLVRLLVAWVLRPDIELQAVLRHGVVVLSRKVLPHAQT